MKPRNLQQYSSFIVYDADRVRQPGAFLFDESYWSGQGAVTGEAAGRGRALFLDTPFGEAVLRRYLRGGLPGRFIRESYLFTGWERSRPVSEFRVLARLAELGLPAPAPFTALVDRRGIGYTGSLLMARIPDSHAVGDHLLEYAGLPDAWARIGACIRHFHDHGVAHADLNARNILVNEAGKVFLIDFDRARIAPGARRVFAANLQRLRRSLEKLWPNSAWERLDICWENLVAGYEAA